MEELQKLADKLQNSIDFAISLEEDLSASSWNYQEGVLLSHNEAKLIVNLVKNLAINNVVSSFIYVLKSKDRVDSLGVYKTYKKAYIGKSNFVKMNWTNTYIEKWQVS
mgnify:CR=1 FL=1